MAHLLDRQQPCDDRGMADEESIRGNSRNDDAKDALDVAIGHERAELDRLDRRLDRVATELATVLTVATAVAALSASVLAAVKHHIGVAGIVLIVVGGGSIAGAVLLCLFSRDPRFRRSSFEALSRTLTSIQLLERFVDSTSGGLAASADRMLGAVAPLREPLRRIGVALPDPPPPADVSGALAYVREVSDAVRAVQEDRQIASLDLGVGALELRRTIAAHLAVRLIFLQEVAEWHERSARVSVVLLASGVLALGAAVAITVA